MSLRARISCVYRAFQIPPGLKVFFNGVGVDMCRVS